MLEWILILTMAGLGAIAFAILFKGGPLDTSELESQKLRQDLNKLAKKEEIKKKEEQKKKAEKVELKQKQKQKEKEKDVRKGAKSSRSPTRERVQEEIVEDEIVPEEETKAIYVPNVPIHNNTPTTKVKRETRDRSPTTEEKQAKKEVNMPSKKQIERDMCQGFVVVQKKGPPPLTAEQREARELQRKREEEEEKTRREQELQRDMERKNKQTEIISKAPEVSLDEVKRRLEVQRLEKLRSKEQRTQVKCVVKQFTKVAAEAEETEKKSWGTAMVPEGEDMPEVDAEDYPRLRD